MRRTLLRLALAASALAAVLLYSAAALAQQDPTPDQLFTALQAHQWAVAAGALTFLLVGLVKQGWLSTWLAQKIPAKFLPYLAVLLTTASLGGAEVARGVDWRRALFSALEAAATAVFLHNAIVQGARNGREVVPQTKALARVSVRPPPDSPPAVVDVPKPPPVPGGGDAPKA